MEKILVYRIGSIGDTIVALPAFWAIRKAFPDAHITYLTHGNSDKAENLLARKILPEGIFDEFMAYPQNFLKNSASLLLTMRKKKIDKVFYLMLRTRGYYRVKRDVLFFRLAGIKEIYGDRYLLKNLLPLNPAKPVKTVETELEYLLNCLYFENLPLPPKETLEPDLKLTAEEIAKAHEWLESRCETPWHEKRLVAVMAGSNWRSKQWAEENYIKVISRLITEKNVFPIVFGGPADREQGERFLKAWKTGANIAGELGLRGDAAVLKECNFYLGTDTGTMHLAGAVGIPCVSIFAATDYPNRWVPYGRGHRIFRERVECEGCFAPACFNNNKCLNLISAERVVQACVEVIENDSVR